MMWPTSDVYFLNAYFARPLLRRVLKYIGSAALIESDAEGIGGSGFVECIGEHINSVRRSSKNS